ncbi:fungal-specific transcription factor domain-containing protein [Stachybotrys elegans]|uniref:Fungal-specific transcription factor domain-containing protein n=1 Tax=Stachybotrys elegans TaxID=80388 RepID=A0A8K0WK76_9HYPO|nr:fungal-specific transcription factor domain-containing protein [Stachybotrys elegans]
MSAPPASQQAPGPRLAITSTYRQKRRQVARACDGCRIHRIKCDDDTPCSNCRAKGRPCSNSGGAKASTLSQAHGEIERLRQRVSHLEAQLERERERDGIAAAVDEHLSPPNSSASTSSPEDGLRPSPDDAVNSIWEGIELRPARSPHTSWFGPSSLYYFISRLSVFLSSSLEQAHPAVTMLPQSASSSTLLNHPPADDEELERGADFLYPDLSVDGVFLSPTQEEYFINLFWQTYHTSLYAILDETEFKKHYQSLWIPATNSRKPSAIVDIVIAMCMQYGISALPSHRQGDLGAGDDATVAGRWHYRRGQMLLASELESPTISTLQCHLLRATYLCGGSFHNMVDSACGLAVRTAYQLGLHMEPLPSVPERERQMRRRLWWAVYFLDSKVGMKLGRPFLVHGHKSMPGLPDDQLETARLSGSMFAPIGQNATWLSFNLHHILLYKVTRQAHTSFYTKDLSVVHGRTVWDDPWALDTLAGVLSLHTKRFDEWARAVPDALKAKRQDGAGAFSTNGSALEMEQYAPLWLQRQRVLLELLYHHLSVTLYRPLISFTSLPREDSAAHSIALKCASHAIELSKITHQVLSSTPILDGWHEAFEWQWSAAMSLVGFLLADPQGHSAAAARDAINIAISVFDIFGANFAAAASAAVIMRRLALMVDLVINQNSERGQYQDDALTGSMDVEQTASLGPELSGGLAGPNMEPHDSFSVADFDLFDMAVGVDFWAELDMLWPGPTKA